MSRSLDLVLRPGLFGEPRAINKSPSEFAHLYKKKRSSRRLQDWVQVFFLWLCFLPTHEFSIRGSKTSKKIRRRRLWRTRTQALRLINMRFLNCQGEKVHPRKTTRVDDQENDWDCV
ncbi:hypothetical protein K435DRAFT_171599 [Dendrothele bispora CBS 962.96]|uniref:Uncharacterized protein n=1 Tax=Dendrothele bispora (strain CBS 962.96) TaxID=1314807 RepID=A0A4S8MWY4_DENBC|nr:hypothetical protein K435DRAFT_171599 [Dendrothele bispora CBS 962.96]